MGRKRTKKPLTFAKYREKVGFKVEILGYNGKLIVNRFKPLMKECFEEKMPLKEAAERVVALQAKKNYEKFVSLYGPNYN